MRKIGRLHVLTDTVLQNRFSHQELARLALMGGADTIQYRQKTGSTREMIRVGGEIMGLCMEQGAGFIVNDRLDVAVACEAHGVHLGQDDFPIPLARGIIGKERIVGGSAATMEEALKCQKEGADYVGFGPVFPTGSKSDAGPVSGIQLLREVVRTLSIPVIAIGGIGKWNLGEVMAAGVHGIAVISAVCCEDDPESATRELQKIIAAAG